MAGSQGSVSIAGSREQGQDVRQMNTTAVMTVANILRSSLGPQGGDKMLVDEIGELTITNDGATILKQLEVDHPAAKLLVELSNLQDQEVGDGTTSVVLLAAELLKRGNELVRQGIHPTCVISGYKLALKRSIGFIQDTMGVKMETLGKNVLQTVANTSLSSKFIGSENALFGQLVADAALSVKYTRLDGKSKAPVGQVNILKCHGQSCLESKLLPGGYAVPTGRSAQGCPMRVSPAKIALLDFALHKHRMGLGVNIEVLDPAELEKIRQREMDITKEKIEKIIASGANVVMCSKGIDDMCLKYFVDAGVYALRRVEKKDMKRLAKCTGATVMLTLATMEGEDKMDPAALGTAEEVSEEQMGDNDFTFVSGCKGAKASTVVLRGSNEYQLDEMERSFHDSLCAVSKAIESNTVVPGGGAVEAGLCVFLESFASSLGTREHEPVAEFAEALLTIPKTLAINAGQDATELLGRLRAVHTKAQKPQQPSDKDLRNSGLDLLEGTVRDSMEAGCLEPMVSKLKQLRFATEAAITILRIDDHITLAPEPEPQR